MCRRARHLPTSFWKRLITTQQSLSLIGRSLSTSYFRIISCTSRKSEASGSAAGVLAACYSSRGIHKIPMHFTFETHRSIIGCAEKILQEKRNERQLLSRTWKGMLDASI